MYTILRRTGGKHILAARVPRLKVKCELDQERIKAQPHEACSATTFGGNIDVKRFENLGFEVEARMSGGRVTTELPITTTIMGEHKNDTLKGELNDGGTKLVLKTSAGSIALRKP